MKTRRIGTFEVSELGIGGMYMSITGRPDEAASIGAIHAAIDGGVTLIDTADVYCLDDSDIGHNERLIRKALSGRRERVVVATKGGLERPGGRWTTNGRPEHLVRACEKSLAALGVDAIDVYQLHAPDDDVPFEESVAAMRKLQDQGKVKHVGLSNVSVDEIKKAEAIVPIVSVQNRWSPSHRAPEKDGVLAHCTMRGIAFLPYSPFGGASGAKSLTAVGSLGALAKSRGVSPHRLVLAWMLAKSPAIIPIPGIRRPESARDSIGASELALTESEVRTIEASFSD